MVQYESATEPRPHGVFDLVVQVQPTKSSNQQRRNNHGVHDKILRPLSHVRRIVGEERLDVRVAVRVSVQYDSLVVVALWTQHHTLKYPPRRHTRPVVNTTTRPTSHRHRTTLMFGLCGWFVRRLVGLAARQLLVHHVDKLGNFLHDKVFDLPGVLVVVYEKGPCRQRGVVLKHVVVLVLTATPVLGLVLLVGAFAAALLQGQQGTQTTPTGTYQHL
mmetsp:Transcript_401/g.1194  ORF Transcript_401/g.1194 Transcript_401/m.1194 type:complete len:217 (+) Transcript_401:2515-3165(+)